MDTQPIYAASLAVSLLAFAIFWSSHSSVVMVIALLATGLAIAPHFPLGMTRSMVASDGRQDRAAAGALAMSGFASGVSPFALGALADRIGIHSAYGIVPMAILIALVVTLYRPIHAHATDS